MKKIIIAIILFSSIASFAQNKPKSVLLMNGVAHIGNGTIIPNSVIGFKDGKFSLIADATVVKIDPSGYDTIINIPGKQVYPGFIACNSTLGLIEVDEVRATNDKREVGEIIPNIRTLIAYNTDSKIIPTVRTNGVLLAQITPREGMLAGTSSVLGLAGWNWEDAVVKSDDGVHLYFPRYPYVKKQDNETRKKEYESSLNRLETFFLDAKAYCQNTAQEEKNLKFEAMKGVVEGSQRLYIHANSAKDILAVINFVKENEIKLPVLIGAKDVWPVIQQLKESNIPVMLGRVHELPSRSDDDIFMPYKLPALLQKEGILFCLQNEGDMEAMNTRNLPFLAGTAAAFGLTKEEALAAITLNAAKILGIDKLIGSMEDGKQATLFISEGDALDMKTNNVTHAFINGNPVNLINEQQELYNKYASKYKIK